MHINMERFIEEVRCRPAIYDTTLPEYCDRAYKKSLWSEICESFTLDWTRMDDEQKDIIGREMKNRWKSIRDAFVREVRYMKEASKFGEPPVKKRKYIYYDQLSFLLPTVGTRGGGGRDSGGLGGLGRHSCFSFLFNGNDDSGSEDHNNHLHLLMTGGGEELEPEALKREEASGEEEVNVVSGSEEVNGKTQEKCTTNRSISTNTVKEEELSSLLNEEREEKNGGGGGNPTNSWCDWSRRKTEEGEVQEERLEVLPIIDSLVSGQHLVDQDTPSSSGIYEGYGITADPDYMFLMSLLPSFKKLEEETKSIIKIEISSVLHSALYGHKRLDESGRRIRYSTGRRS